jgi:hypothetical protein
MLDMDAPHARHIKAAKIHAGQRKASQHEELINATSMLYA